MAIRVEPGADIVFGVMAGPVAVTHVRVQKAGTDATTRALASTLNVPTGGQLQIPSTSFDIVYPDGQMSRDHMDALVRSYWDGETFQIDCLTAVNTVVADANYSQQTHSAWTFTSEND